jgi:hypothetical protein
VQAPEPGYLWTPGYWGYDNGVYLWHGGYWGTEIGFYCGVNYGFGYFGRGYDGGYWDHGQFRYNTAYTRVGDGVHITNVYNKVVINPVTVNHVSFNGGRGGIDARPSEREVSAEHARHIEPVSAQIQHSEAAHHNPELRLSTNHGHPGVAATSRPGEFTGHGVIPAHGAPAVTHDEARRGPEVNRAPEQHTAPANLSHAPAAPVIHDHALPPQQHTATPPPEQRPEFQRTPEVPHNNVQPPHAPPPPQPQVHAPQPPPQPQVHAPPPPPPQQHEQRQPPAREPEKREEPHGQ